jgi:hypothetical protein
MDRSHDPQGFQGSHGSSEQLKYSRPLLALHCPWALGAPAPHAWAPQCRHGTWAAHASADPLATPMLLVQHRAATKHEHGRGRVAASPRCSARPRQSGNSLRPDESSPPPAQLAWSSRRRRWNHRQESVRGRPRQGHGRPGTRAWHRAGEAGSRRRARASRLPIAISRGFRG